jgi:hypothetical protein
MVFGFDSLIPCPPTRVAPFRTVVLESFGPGVMLAFLCGPLEFAEDREGFG